MHTNDSCIINPMRFPGESLLPVRGILAVNPGDLPALQQAARHFAMQRHRLFHSNLFSTPNFFLAGPAMGAPMAVICLEKLIALGAQSIIVYGWCGSLSPSLQGGELFMPTDALSEEGTSPHYPAPMHQVQTVTNLFDMLAEKGFSPSLGRIWTTDALYRETKEKIQQYQKQGLLAVDMEYSALRAVAHFRAVALSALMITSDELFHSSWRPGFTHKQFRKKSKIVLETLCSILETGKVG